MDAAQRWSSHWSSKCVLNVKCTEAPRSEFKMSEVAVQVRKEQPVGNLDGSKGGLESQNESFEMTSPSDLGPKGVSLLVVGTLYPPGLTSGRRSG